MASTSYKLASGSATSHGNPLAFVGESTSLACSHSNGGLNDHRVLQPDDFKRVKSQLSLRSRPASRIDYIPNSESSSPAALISHLPSRSQDASLPPDFDLVVQSRPRDLIEREGGNRETFGPCNEDAEASEDESSGAIPTELKEELASIADEASDDEAIPIQPQPESTPASSSSLPGDAHLSQLKQEAEKAWATYRPGMTPQQCTVALESDMETGSAASDQPAHIPQRVTSLRRNSLIVLTSLPKHDSEHQRDSVATTSGHSHTSSVHAHDKAVPSARSARTEFETFPRITTSISSGASFRGRPSSEMHFQRPHTASILSSTSEGSFLSYQNSFESGMSPLLLNRAATSTRLSGRLHRPATSGSIPHAELNFSRPLPSPGASSRPETSNQLTAEERRQQVRRTKKLTQMLGEEMLLAPNAPRSLGPSVDSRRNKKYRPQSMPFNNDLPGLASSAPAFGSTASSKTRALSRKLLQSRSHAGKSWDLAFSGLESSAPSTPVQGLNRKAAAILGLPHPYSSSVLARTSGEEFLESEEELDVMEEINPSARPFIPSGLEEFSEPTPKVAQLAAFSAAALDEGASPTLPQDGIFRPFDNSHLDQALAMSESRKLAAARDERRRRVAKMSRWLGEAVPAELIHSGAHQSQNAVIRSTGTLVSSDPSLMSHDSGYTVSERDSTRRTQPSSACNSSSLGHGSLSHESSVASNLQSFMSIDSSDDESDSEAVAASNAERRSSRPLAESRSVGPSPLNNNAALPVTSDSIYSYRNSIESYEYLLEYDRERLSELASIFHDTRVPAVANTTTVDTVVPRFTRLPRSAAHPHTSDSMATTRSDPVFSSRPSQTHISAGYSPATRPITLSASVGGIPRRSAAFLELSDSESDSSEAEELHDDEIDFSPSTLRQRRMDSHDRSISKLSNFFGSTPSQIVRSQSDIRAATSSADSVSTVEMPTSASAAKMSRVRGRALSQPDALKTILTSLEEAMDDSKLTNFQKSEISRKVHLLKKRTTKMFA
ncbi:hypothetical protein NDA16_001202 [Ustilago loliicola]|nr:hypothetical protein NDA16_001202 [Ustilago loliicola]